VGLQVVLALRCTQARRASGSWRGAAFIHKAPRQLPLRGSVLTLLYLSSAIEAPSPSLAKVGDGVVFGV